MKTRDPSPAPDWLAVDAAVEAFEMAYAAAGTADPADYCPPPADPLHRPVAAELVRADLEFAARDGRPKRLDGYRPLFPALFADPAALGPVAFEEYRLRKQAGEQVAPAEYQQRYGVDTAGWAAAGRPKSNPSFALPGGLTDVLGDLSGDARSAAAGLGLAAGRFPDPGAEVAGFRLVGELGRGAFARVYLAEQADLAGRFVALKLSTKLVAEAQTLARLQHTNIVPVYSVHRAGPFHAVCMPFLGSVTLADVLRRLRDQDAMPLTAAGLFSTLADRMDGSTLPPASGTPAVGVPDGVPAPPPDPAGLLDGLRRKSHVEAVLWIGAELADGLAHAHDRGVVHRDVKPANVLLADDGRPMLLDFNLAGDARQADPLAGAVGGTPAYMAPEQLDALAGKPAAVDARADVYALGLILYHLLTGRSAHTLPDDPARGTADKLRAARAVPPVPAAGPNPAVTPAVDAILAKCLAPAPADRYPSARHLREDLLRQLDNRPLRYAPDVSLQERAGKFVRRNPWTRSVVFLGTLLAAVLAGGAAVVWKVTTERDAAARSVADRRFRDEAADLRLALAAGDDHRQRQAVTAAKQTLARFGLPGGDGAAPDYLLAGRETAEARAAAADLYVLLGGVETGRSKEWAGLAGGYAPARTAPLRGWLANPTEPTGDPELDVLLSAQRRNQPRRILAVLDARPPATLPVHHWVAKAECHTALGQHAEAAACYTTALALAGKPNPDLSAARGRSLLEAGRAAAAVADFDAALTQTPDAAGTRLNRALALLKLGRYPEAVTELDRVVEHWPGHTRALFVRAEAKAKAGDKAGAAADRKLALATEPGDETSWLARGMARLNAGDATGAAADFDAVLAQNPRSRDARQNKAAVLGDHQNRPAEAVALLDGLVADWPEFVPARAGRGVYLARLGKRDAAHADAKAVLAADPPPFFRYQVAGIYALTSKSHPADAAEAVRLLASAFQDRAGLEYVPTDPDLAPLRADRQFQKLVQAAQDLARAAGRKP